MIKKYILAFLLLELFFSYAPVYAQSVNNGLTYDYSQAGVSAQIEKYLCAPTTVNQSQTSNTNSMFTGMTETQKQAALNNANAGDLYRCINQLYKLAIVVASVVGVFFIVIAGYIYMSANGEAESVTKAKNILETTIVSLVILLAGYVLLKAINPDLIQFQPIQPPSVVPATSTPTTSGINPEQGAVPGDVIVAAKTLLSLNGSKLSIADSGCDCPNNCAINTLQSLAAGKQAQVDGPNSICAAGYTTVSTQMLAALVTIAVNGSNFTISSITGGHHSNPSDPHYQGRAVDLIPNPRDAATQHALVTGLQNYSASVIAIECVYSGSSVYWPIPAQASADDNRCIGKSNYHIHAQW